MCRINPKIDFAFKKLFGSEENKDLLISLINSIISEKDKITNIILRTPYNLADYQSGKISFLDVKAEDEKGKWFNILIQVGEDLYFDNRSIHYIAKMITDQLSERMMFKRPNKTISINILDFNILESIDFHNTYKILNEKTLKDVDLPKLFEIHYIELQKFKKDYKDIVNSLDRWMTFFTKANELDEKHLPKQLSNDPHIVKAINTIDRMFDEEERSVYADRLQQQKDFESKIDSSNKKTR